MRQKQAWSVAVGLFVLRVGLAAPMAVAHGWSKLQGFAEMSEKFPDPLGIGSFASLSLAVAAEFFASLLLILGLAGRLCALMLAVTMAVAAFIVHADDPWQKKELAVIYFVGFVALTVTGPGRLSVDSLFVDKWRKKKKS